MSSTPSSSRPVRQSTRKKLGATPRDSPAAPNVQQPQAQSTPVAVPQQQAQPSYPAYYQAAALNQANYASQAPYYGAVPPIIPTAVPQAVAPTVPPIPITTQALTTSYASRMKTGVTLLMQPIIATAAATTTVGGRKPRVNYAEGLSGDDFEDDSDDSEAGVARARRAAASKAAAQALLAKPSNELDQSYLGKIPPSKYITSKPALRAKHQY
jgi:chromatin structure-remodeling complex subunit SFH1